MRIALRMCVCAALLAVSTVCMAATEKATVPLTGKSRIAVVVVGKGPVADSAAERLLFSNKLDARTFRNYWSVNSIGRCDTEVTVIRDEGAPPPPACKPGDASCRKWDEYAAGRIAALTTAGKLDSALFDINGPDRVPDGVLDGVVILIPGMVGAHPLFLAGPGKIEPGMTPVKTVSGPVLIAGNDASDYELLRGFAALFGFEHREPGADGKGGLCFSLAGIRQDGMPLLDAYTRLKAGWTNPIRLKESMQQIMLMPARTSGDVYIIGREKEYFILESRASGEGYDEMIEEPRLAVYHVDENAAGDSVWHPRVMNESPDASFAAQASGSCSTGRMLFSDGDSMKPDYSSQNPISGDAHSLNTNWYSGEPSDIVIKDVDVKSRAPLISVVIGVE